MRVRSRGMAAMGICSAAFLAVAAGLSAAGKGTVESAPEGCLLVPEKPAAGLPVLVIAESPARGRALLDMMADGLKTSGVIAIVPTLKLEGNAVAAGESMKRVDALLQRVEKQAGAKPGKLTAFSFSASGALGYQLACQNASRFAGLIVAASFPPAPNDLKGTDAKKIPVLLAHGERDDMCSPALGAQAKKVLEAAGFKATLKIVPGAGHMDMVQKNAPAYLSWIAGGAAAGK
jgi:fermentation-respiration switch protein FrsA (DUF1100 family)